VVAEGEHRGEGPRADDDATVGEGALEEREDVLGEFGRERGGGEELAGGEAVEPVVGGVEAVGDAGEVFERERGGAGDLGEERKRAVGEIGVEVVEGGDEVGDERGRGVELGVEGAEGGGGEVRAGEVLEEGRHGVAPRGEEYLKGGYGGLGGGRLGRGVKPPSHSLFLSIRRSGFADEAGFEGEGDAVDLAGDLVVAVDEADVFGFRAGFQNLGTAEFEVFDDGDGIAVGEDVAVSIFDDAGLVGGGRFFFGPFVSAGGALPVIGVTEDVVERAGGTGRIGHRSGKSVTMRKGCVDGQGGRWGAMRTPWRDVPTWLS